LGPVTDEAGSHDPNERVTAIEAVRRQLDAAVRLYFERGDTVSIHTLACAAHDVLRRLNKAAGGDLMLVEGFVADLVLPASQKPFLDLLREAQNFFKHAGRDEVRLVPWYTNVVMLDACLVFRKLTSQRLPIFEAFVGWSALTWGAGTVVFPGLDPSEFRELAADGRKAFLATFTRMIND
jgi:hypothetical protein